MTRGVKTWGEKRVCLECCVRGRVRFSRSGGRVCDEERAAGGGKMNFSGSELKL